MKQTFLCAILAFPLMVQAASTQCEQRLAQLGKDWTYAVVEAPLNHESPKKNELIPIHYYFKKDQARFKEQTPILFINGGPTVSSASGSGIFDRVKELKDANIILMDQRGTGCSGRFPDYDQKKDLAEYKNFSSTSIVKDAELIRKKIRPGKKWKILGQSFGGLTSFRYIELFPQSLHSAHIHGFGFVPKGGHLLDIREQRLHEVGADFLAFHNEKRETRSIGELIDYLTLPPLTEAHIILSNICIPTPGGKKDKICGREILGGLFLLIGFKNQWPLAHDKLARIVELMEQSKFAELDTFYRNFANTYILRFNDRDQAYALNIITYLELIPGNFFYSGCKATRENEVLSECRFSSNYLARLPQQPAFRPAPISLTKVRNNIKKHSLPVHYYAGLQDTFLPSQLLVHTAQVLNIEDRLMIFPESGHEGFYTEPKLIQTLLIE